MNSLNNAVYFHDEEYFMQAISMKELCDNHETPFYLYDMNDILNKQEQLTKYFSWNKLKIFYAMKANYNPHILQVMNENGFCLDTVSPAEMLLALRIGFDKDRILFTANNMTDTEMNIVQQQGVLLNIDSLSRLERYSKCFPGSKVSLRINPGVVAGENKKVQTAGDFNKFGILLIDIPKALEITKQYGIKIVGLHEHTGSGISDTAKALESMNNLLGIASRQEFPDLEFIDFGGGFKVRYHPEEVEIDYETFGEKTIQLFDRFCKGYGKELALYFEPGKYIVAESGCLVVKVNTIKKAKERYIIGTDSGFPHMIRPVLYGAYHHIINISNPFGELGKYDIYGNICESGDCFASDREIPEIREGDYLAIQNTGAYCCSMASNYNLRPIPSEYIIYNNELLVSRQKDTHAELADKVLSDYGFKGSNVNY
jgi:diaminopimelate decarboxylase